jgi:hypothetical protein
LVPSRPTSSKKEQTVWKISAPCALQTIFRLKIIFSEFEPKYHPGNHPTFLRTEKSFRKIMGYRDLWALEAILYGPQSPTPQVVA